KKKVAVNYFASTKEYVQVKPDYYVICSPEYFVPEDKKDYAEQRALTFKALIEKTAWPMVFVVPALAKSRKSWQKPFIDHEYIQLRFMNTTPVEGFRWFRHRMFQSGIGMPRPHNVLVACIYLSIKIRFKEVYVAGADHSWLKEIFVTEENDVLVGQKHFYDQQTKNQTVEVNRPDPKPMYKGGTTQTRRLHEVLEKFYVSFKSYWVLKSFADAMDVPVFNVTEGSFIDAFERKRIL
ncbi:MAG: hypothetical protein AAGA66_18750, partial [Bacteroidota bacterium]